MNKPRRPSKNTKKKKHPSYWVFVCLVFSIVFLALCTVRQFKNTEMPDTSISERKTIEKVPKPTREQKTKKSPAKPEVDFYNTVTTITAAPEFSYPVFTIGQKGETIAHTAYSLSYDEDHEQAHWVSYKLTRSMIGGSEKRNNHFREDPKVSTASASPLDYRLSGYDRGHLAPAGDFTHDAKAMDESFYMSNMSPQLPSFNRGIWKKLEDQVRYWANENEEIYIVTGPVNDKKEISLGINKVTVPAYFYKVILDIHPPEYKAIAFLMKNEKSTRPLLEYAITVDSLERFTGLDFFPMLPDTLEKRLENMKNHEIWFE